jgi:hypothetical protein
MKRLLFVLSKLFWGLLLLAVIVAIGYSAVKEPVWFACWLLLLDLILRFNHNAKTL